MNVNSANQTIKITTFITKKYHKERRIEGVEIGVIICMYVANGHCYYSEIAPLHKVFLNKKRNMLWIYTYI